MTTNDQARRDSTMLSLIAQARARGSGRGDVVVYLDRLSAGARVIAEAMFGAHADAQVADKAQYLLEWAKTLPQLRRTSRAG